MELVNGSHQVLRLEKNKIKILKEIKFPNSLGLLYSAFTYYLGFKVNSGEYKVWVWHHMESQNMLILY